ncbi:MAG: hypothetical protein ACRDAX_00920 [Propionibacteriaceae bacterium]
MILCELFQAPEEEKQGKKRQDHQRQHIEINIIINSNKKKQNWTEGMRTYAENMLNKMFNNEEDHIEKRPSIKTNYIYDLLDYIVSSRAIRNRNSHAFQLADHHAPMFTFKCKLNVIERTAEAKRKLCCLFTHGGRTAIRSRQFCWPQKASGSYK